MPSITDLLFQFTEWLRTTQVVELALWLTETPVSLWIQQHFFAIPIIQTIHILAVATAFGSALMMNLRILGVNGKSLTVTQTAQRYVAPMWWALIVLIISGIGLIIGEPVRELVNPIFWIKMILVVTAVLLNLWYQASVRRKAPVWDTMPGGRGGIRFGAIGLLLLWCAIMAGGRWIAYAPV